jgi:hypothetical protein
MTLQDVVRQAITDVLTGVPALTAGAGEGRWPLARDGAADSGRTGAAECARRRSARPGARHLGGRGRAPGRAMRAVSLADSDSAEASERRAP